MEKLGKVEDFLIHPKTWAIDFLVVDTGHWLPGKKVTHITQMDKRNKLENFSNYR